LRGIAKSKRPFSVGDAVKRASQPLYHYTRIDAAIAILQTKTFWMSEAASFNDPYDCRLQLKNDHLVEACLAAIGAEVRNSLKGIPTKLDGKLSFENVKKESSLKSDGKLLINRLGRIGLKKWVTNALQICDSRINILANEVRAMARVTCFCKSGTKLPLWGYYADSGAGACLIVDFNKKHWGTELLEVKYEALVPSLLTISDWLEVVFDLRPLHIVLPPDAIVKRLFQTKSKDWEHEDEVRFAGVHVGPPGQRDTLTCDGDEIIGVLAGYRVCNEQKKKLKQIARACKIPYGQVKMRDTKYELYFD
jgi:hypothetical protein